MKRSRITRNNETDHTTIAAQTAMAHAWMRTVDTAVDFVPLGRERLQVGAHGPIFRKT